MTPYHPRQIIGKWRQGYALDLHTLTSVFVGYDEFGHPRFDTTRSELGELLLRLKYRSDQTVVDDIIAASVSFLSQWRPSVDMIVPVPPSSARAVQPVLLLAQRISARLGILHANCVIKLHDTPQLKNIFDLDERLKVLEGAHAVDPVLVENKKILLFDDLFRSGATMNAITTVLYEQGRAAEVYALAVTRTRSHQ